MCRPCRDGWTGRFFSSLALSQRDATWSVIRADWRRSYQRRWMRSGAAACDDAAVEMVGQLNTELGLQKAKGMRWDT